MKNFFNDFKKFISKGNVIDLAVGVIMGTAFTAIVNSIVKDILMPLISGITGTSLSGWVWVVNNVPQYLEDGVTLNPEAIIVSYGNLIQAIINFFIIALVLFIIVRAMMKAKGFSADKYCGYDKKEYKTMRKSGMTKKDIEDLAAKRDAEAAEKAKAEEAIKAANTTEALLKDIKTILEKSVDKK